MLVLYDQVCLPPVFTEIYVKVLGKPTPDDVVVFGGRPY